MVKRKIEDVIKEQGQLIYTSVGDSMYPLIREGDLIIISAVDKPLKKYDVPLYKRDSGQYVLHRIVGFDKDGYVICGDNRADVEHGITDRHIIGVLTGIVRDGETLPADPPAKGLYDRLWLSCIPFRKIVMKSRRIFK